MKVKVKKTPKKAAKELKKLSKNLSGPETVKVGLPKGSNDYPDGTSVIMVGAVHEFGSPRQNIPQRSYLRSTIFENKSDYKLLFRKLSKKIVNSNLSTKEALKIVGITVQKNVVEKITNLQDPPLKSRVGNPLIDTGHLRQSITFKVDD